MTQKTIKLRLKKPISGHPVGHVVTVAVDREGTVIDQFWRRRVYDSQMDDCLEVVKATKRSEA